MAQSTGMPQLSEITNDSKKIFRKEESFCFDVGLYYYGFTSPNGRDQSHDSIKLGSLGSKFLKTNI